jgi:type II secretory pathway pseudopilin PulG
MSKGYSFIEILIVTLILTVILGGVFGIAYQAQMSFDSEKQFTETTQHARIAMDQIVRYLRQAGNDPEGGMRTNKIPAIQLSGTSAITVNTDITGSVGGTLGDPDGLLTSPLESVFINYNSALREVSIRLQGEPAQVMADNISDCTFVGLDANGSVTSDGNQVVAVRVTMTADTARRDRRTGRINSVTFSSDVFIRSRSYDLFGGATRQ